MLAPLGSCKFLAKQLVDYTDRWPSGMEKTRGQLLGEIQQGEWTLFYESGRPLAKGTYENDRQVGGWTFYHENGNVMRAGTYSADGLRSGEWIYNYEDLTPQSRGAYVADFEDGPWTFWFENGAVSMRGSYDAGQQSGLWRYYYADGSPKAEGLYHEGARIGAWQVWSEDGKSRVQDFGRKVGVTLVRELWPDTEQVRRTGVLVSGKPVGRWQSQHDNGELRFCCGFTNGTPNGIFEAHGADGSIVAKGRFDNGAIAADGIAVDADEPRALAAGPMPPFPATAETWCAREALAELKAEQQLSLFVAEAREAAPDPAFAPIALAPAEVPTESAPAPAPEQVVAEIESQPSRMPAQAQPQLTVKQKREMESYIAEYTDGPKQGSSMFSDYAPSASGPRPTTGTGRRPNLEGKPLPFDKMKCVDDTEVDLTDYHGKQRVMIVVLRGFLGEVCCYCVAQTKALARARKKLEQANVEVLVIYPGKKENEYSFRRLYEQEFGEGPPPYKVFYDPQLVLVKQLGIEGDLASPTTIIVDEQGIVQYAYVGEHRADRPATNKLIELIEGMTK